MRSSSAASPTLSAADSSELEDLALRVREHILRMSTNGGCFLGASLSCADLIVYLYKRVLRVDPERPADPRRDYFFLSKGHDVPALYGTLAELGFIDRQRLRCHLQRSDSLYWHPSTDIPGVEFHSGSLGHLLSVAIGVALDIKLRRDSNRVFVLLGDGELNEGSIWEGLLVAQAYRLDNLTLIVDRNGFQANARTEELIPLEPLEDKFVAFGWAATTINGHRFNEMSRALAVLPSKVNRPTAVIANTVRGKGVASIENRADRWFADLTDSEVAALLDELHGKGIAKLTSKVQIVR